MPTKCSHIVSYSSLRMDEHGKCARAAFVEETNMENTTPQKRNEMMPKDQRMFTKEFKLVVAHLMQTSGKPISIVSSWKGC